MRSTFRFASLFWAVSFLLPLLLAGGMPARSAAQSGKGVLSGVVLNSQGRPAAGALVYYQDAEGKTPHALRTDANGHFQSRPLSPNLYEVRAEAGGMWSEWSRNVIVRGGDQANVTLRLVRATAPHP